MRNDIEEYLYSSPSSEAWRLVGVKKHSGIHVSLAALFSRSSAGIGEFLDLLPLIEWCHAIGLDLIQLLPLTHSESDPSPYNGDSSCALNFLYLSLESLPYLVLFPQLFDQLAALRFQGERRRVDYQRIYQAKEKWLRSYYELVFSYVVEQPNFVVFCQENSWLESFAIFRVLKKRFPSTPHWLWPQEYQSYDPARLSTFIEAEKKEILFVKFLQFLCHEQLVQVKKHAAAFGVLLMGDLPLFVNSDSADLWAFPQYFDCAFEVGAPPDSYSPQGQRWGFPLPKWNVMQSEGHLWWKARLAYAARFFDICRIDHILGLFRLWIFPSHNIAEKGRFYPSDPSTWKASGELLLSFLVENSPMLLIGEDLGDMPIFVPEILTQYGVCGIRVARWAFDASGQTLLLSEQYPQLAISCFSTHDSSTLAQWWASDDPLLKAWLEAQGIQWTAELAPSLRLKLLEKLHASASLFEIHLLQELLALYPPWVGNNLDEERINIPGTISLENWTYRYRVPIETFCSTGELFRILQKLYRGALPSVNL